MYFEVTLVKTMIVEADSEEDAIENVEFQYDIDPDISKGVDSLDSSIRGLWLDDEECTAREIGECDYRHPLKIQKEREEAALGIVVPEVE
jgi:hypothetical protein